MPDHGRERRWQIHSIGTRVEAGSQVDDHVDALPDLLLNEFVVRISACDPGPRCALAERHGFRDVVAALAREAPRKWIAENRIGPFCFAGAVDGREERGIGDIADERFAGAHSDSLARFRSLSDSAIGLHTRIQRLSKRRDLRMHMTDNRVTRQVDNRRNPALPLRREELASHRTA